MPSIGWTNHGKTGNLGPRGMKIIRYLDSDGSEHYGALAPDGSAIELAGALFSQLRPTYRPAQIKKLLAPLVPSQILGIGLNYRRHAEETKAKVPEFPVLFGKALNSLQNPGDPIFIPTRLASEQVDYECELAVVISRPCKNIDRAQALDFVLGYTCANDVSARDWQKKKGGGQWSRGKSFDSFCPLGPCLVTPDEIPNPNALAIRTILNGHTVQDWNTNDMIFDVPSIIEFLSGSTTLLAGTTILTGTPHGVGMAVSPPRWLKPGDSVSVEIENIGTLTNPVELER
jgi:2-keto-4-pentenoate hydratase/2-oxohepta-3-ene-1,7-dioic acid hydratase in catechol pathway